MAESQCCTTETNTILSNNYVLQMGMLDEIHVKMYYMAIQEWKGNLHV